MKWLNHAEIDSFLKLNGVASEVARRNVIRGFDLSLPVYEQLLQEGDEVFQFVRNPSATNLSPDSGSWFALPGATTQSVAILDGGSGRRLHRFRVERSFIALEGTAKEFPLTWKLEIGGKGGATQIFVPPNFLGHFSAVSAAAR